MEITLHGETVTVEKERYPNGARRINLYDEMGLPYATCTMQLEGVTLADDEVIIKNHSENEGVLDILIQNNVVELTDKVVTHGFVRSSIVRVLI